MAHSHMDSKSVHSYICMIFVNLLFQSNTQDQILLQWESGKSATINVLVVHAMIILLTYSEPRGR